MYCKLLFQHYKNINAIFIHFQNSEFHERDVKMVRLKNEKPLEKTNCRSNNRIVDQIIELSLRYLLLLSVWFCTLLKQQNLFYIHYNIFMQILQPISSIWERMFQNKGNLYFVQKYALLCQRQRRSQHQSFSNRVVFGRQRLA